MEHEDLIKLITEIVKKEISKQNFSRMYPAIVDEVDYNNLHARVHLAGFDTSFYFPNKTGNTLYVGEGVYVESIGNNLSNGVIAYTFG